MRAVIFNSGMGSRMGRLTRLQPKCMAELYNTETIFARQVRILSACGVEEFVVTTGPFADQIAAAAAVCQSHNPRLRFVFVPNPQYRTTNYIVSMYLARAYLDTGLLLLHGDLVFNEGLVWEMLSDPAKSLCLYHEDKILPRKDFKAQFCNGILKKVSVRIFGADCYAFQPLYKLDADAVRIWRDRVVLFVESGKKQVYAEEALNEVTSDVGITGMSYKPHYIDEIDNAEDYCRVSEEIRRFDSSL
ncbi:MAG: NTP transferase domain-containing protein [Lachnospiraceae bacterium]|nr:NTP transferase domain-containing protein [Lachnospiraceae bacterium]